MKPEGLTHLDIETRNVADDCDEDRIAHICRKRWTEYPAAKEVGDKILSIYHQQPSERMKNLLLIGESGVGKTSLLGSAERTLRTSLYTDLSIPYQPLVRVLTPHIPTEKNILGGILRALDAPPVKLSHFRTQMLEEVSAHLRSLGTRVLIFDEINSLLSGTPRQRRRALQLLRYLSSSLKIALVFVGVPEGRAVLDADDQLKSRFSEVVLPKWKVGPDLQNFVINVVRSMPLRLPSPVQSTQLCRVLAERSDGITERIVDAIRHAAVIAVREGKERIDPAALLDDRVWKEIVTSAPPYSAQHCISPPAQNPAPAE